MNIDILMREAMRAQQTTVLGVLRTLKSEFTKVLTSKGRNQFSPALTEDEEFAIIRKQIAQREESMKMFHQAGRTELANKEEQEKAILEAFLPPSLSDYDIGTMVERAITNSGAVTKRDTGKAIALAKEYAAGRVDLKVLSSLIASKLV